MTGTLYILATPIGNLEDITLRAIRILSEADIILAEDTRVTQKLLNSLDSRVQIQNSKLISYHQHSTDTKKTEILTLLLTGKNIVLVTDAGTPGISDPGNELIDFIGERSTDIAIVPIPGASALTSALSISGFRTDKFVFLGFWPKKKTTKLIKSLLVGNLPFVFYESPYRILKTLEIVKANFGESVRVCVARELTKMYETIYRGYIDEVIGNLKAEKKLKGEIVVMVELPTNRK